MQVSPSEPVVNQTPLEEIKEAEIDQNSEIIVRRKKRDTRHFKKKAFEPVKPKLPEKDEISVQKLEEIFLSKENVRKNTNEASAEADFILVKES